MATPIIHSFGKALASRLITNNHLATLMDTSDEWITQRTGIKSRYWATPEETTSSLGIKAAQQSLTAAKSTTPIDCIIAATLSPDFCFPGLGVQLQHGLGLGPIPAFDVRNQCSGFLYSLQMAAAFIQAGTYRKILVVGSEVHSTGLDITTRGRDVAVLFGDGAGSCLVEAAPDNTPPASLSTQPTFTWAGALLHSDGAFIRELWCQNPGSANATGRVVPAMLEDLSIFPKMNGKVVFEHAVRGMTQVSMKLLASLQLSPRDVALLIPHQANLRINLMVAESLQLPAEKCFNTISVYGNTTAATIPIGFTDAIAQGKIPSSGVILSAAFGAGFTWGAAALRCNAT